MTRVTLNYETLNVNTGERLGGDTQEQAERYARQRGTPGDYVETYAVDPLNNKWFVRGWNIGVEAIAA